MDSATSISYITWKVSPFDAGFRLIMAIFHCACAVSTHITTFGSKSDVMFEFSASLFPLRHGHFGRATPFSATFVAIMSAHAQ